MNIESLWIEAVGIMAGCLTTASFLPQVIRTWKTRSARDLSLGMYAIFSTGVALWLVYGLLIGSPSVILANVVTLILAASILVMKILFK